MSDDRATNRLSRRKNSGSWLVGVCTAGSPRPGRGVAPLFGSRGAVHATSRASTFCSPAAGGPARRRPRGSPRPLPAARARDAAIFLLHTAAEIEHALLVQYLYAAYSLGDPKDKTLRAWQDSIVTIAKQEMSHLMTVQGLLRFLGGPPN